MNRRRSLRVAESLEYSIEESTTTTTTTTTTTDKSNNTNTSTADEPDRARVAHHHRSKRQYTMSRVRKGMELVLRGRSGLFGLLLLRIRLQVLNSFLRSFLGFYANIFSFVGWRRSRLQISTPTPKENSGSSTLDEMGCK